MVTRWACRNVALQRAEDPRVGRRRPLSADQQRRRPDRLSVAAAERRPLLPHLPEQRVGVVPHRLPRPFSKSFPRTGTAHRIDE